MLITKGKKKMEEEEIPRIKSGICQISGFKTHMIKQIDDLFNKLTEIQAKDHKITSVSYTLEIEVE